MSSDPSIFTIDTAFQRSDFDAAYLIVENDRAAFIDCGTGLAVPAMLATHGPLMTSMQTLGFAVGLGREFSNRL